MKKFTIAASLLLALFTQTALAGGGTQGAVYYDSGSSPWYCYVQAIGQYQYNASGMYVHLPMTDSTTIKSVTVYIDGNNLTEKSAPCTNTGITKDESGDGSGNFACSVNAGSGYTTMTVQVVYSYGGTNYYIYGDSPIYYNNGNC